ncbi:DUF1963 domain-containing protein [Aestuariibius insulae]|uniref:DUF1963 domain-containing protein n=1 Tax=Aestuariibius insulae TaxID=2058287 RepID=UPI00345E3366
MGGWGGEVQESATINEKSILLFQAASDEIVRFMWGDVGLMQFWISAEALAERDWSKVQVTVEGH